MHLQWYSICVHLCSSVANRIVFVTFAILLILTASAHAQKVPEVGYVFPPGGKAGTTVEVRLAGYDWTPDMEYFTLDRRVTLTPVGVPGPILIPGPPYWFGAKGRLGSLPLPREVSAKLVIPADVSGPIYWQAANANGCTSAGVFIVGAGTEVVEEEGRKTPQLLASLPVTVSGRIRKIEEVDRYRFVAPKDGPITCQLMARRIGAKFFAVMEVHDAKGARVADVAGTNGEDPSLTFVARAKAEYVISLHDIDFGGDRSYVYRLGITAGPRVVGALPAAGRRGETREVEFVGVGVATGAAKLESVKRKVTFPATGSSFDYSLDTPWGTAPAFPLLLSDLPESVAAARTGKAEPLPLPAGVSGVLEQADATGRFSCAWKKGEVWSLALEARAIGSPLDVALSVLGPDGKQVAHNDDLLGTTDAGLEFTVPADGTYQVVVSDVAGKSGSRAAIYRLVVQKRPADFALQLSAERLPMPIGSKTNLVVKALRQGDFKGPISLTVRGLPAGASVPPNLVIPPGKGDLLVPLTIANDAGSGAALVTIEGTATVGAKAVTRPALAPTTVNLAPRDPDKTMVPSLLLAVTMKPRFKGRPVDQDTGRKVHRGSTFPAEVIVERLEGFAGEVVLQMAAQQSYQHQGITGGDVVVPPGVGRTVYPCFMPEWLETTRTSRMAVIGVARVPDPKGKVRHLVGEITGFITMTMEGSLLKIAAPDADLTVLAGQAFDVRLEVARLTKLTEPARLELRVPEGLKGQLEAKPVTLDAKTKTAVLHITTGALLRGRHTLTIRAMAMQDGKYPVISETTVSVDFLPIGPAPR
jgi:hypothetical protein